MSSANGYYARSLSGERLRRCYALASPEVQDYLRGENERLLASAGEAGRVLELGCGYGRILSALAGSTGFVAGIDTALASLALARVGGERVAAMNAARLGFAAGSFDLVACLQNGIAVFGVDRDELVGEAVRVLRPGGKVLLSSYSPAFWPHRLQWFERQSALGLVGPIDRDATRPGRIVCRDGFVSATVSADELASLASRFGLYEITDDGRSVFCEITPHHGREKPVDA